jgi:hypothetical protein
MANPCPYFTNALPKATMPGGSIGTVTRTNTVSGLAANVRAASSQSLSWVLSENCQHAQRPQSRRRSTAEYPQSAASKTRSRRDRRPSPAST